MKMDECFGGLWNRYLDGGGGGERGGGENMKQINISFPALSSLWLSNDKTTSHQWTENRTSAAECSCYQLITLSSLWR